MEIPAHLGKQFVEFTHLRYGSDIRLHSDEQRAKTKELARGFIRDDFICIRYAEGIADVPLGEGVCEVVCSNADRLSKLEEDWTSFVSQAISEGLEDDDELEIGAP